MKTQEDVIKDLNGIVTAKEKAIERFKEGFEIDPRGAVKWFGRDIMVYDEAAEQAGKIIAHIQSGKIKNMEEYVVFKERQLLEIAVQFDCNNECSSASRAAWFMLWQAFKEE